MRRSFLKLRWGACLVALAMAAPAGAKKKSDPAEEQAKERFASAQKAYDLARFEEALKLYSQAYELKPLPGFLFNIAQCHRQLNDLEKARFFYKRYMDLSPTRPKNAEQVEELLKQVEATLAEAKEPKRPPVEPVAAVAEAKPTPPPVEPQAAPVTQTKPLEAWAPMPEAAPIPPLVNTAPMTPPPPEALTKKWWFWTGVGVVAAGAATVALSASPRRPPASLGEVNAQ